MIHGALQARWRERAIVTDSEGCVDAMLAIGSDERRAGDEQVACLTDWLTDGLATLLLLLLYFEPSLEWIAVVKGIHSLIGCGAVVVVASLARFICRLCLGELLLPINNSCI